MAILTTLTYNGKELDPRVFRVEHLPDYTIPQRDLQATHVEGRSGDIVVDSKSYKNIPRSYNVSFAAAGPEDFAAKVSEISKWLGVPGYAPLYDTYEKDYYRMAYPSGSYKVQSILNGQAGKVTIDFSCIPKRFFKYGENQFTETSPAAAEPNEVIRFRIYNPSPNDALPLIYMLPKNNIHGTVPPNNIPATATINFGSQLDVIDYQVTIDTSDLNHFSLGPLLPFNLAIDGESENAYFVSDGSNQNSRITLRNDKFPVFPGETNMWISFTNDISTLVIIPRFWIR